MKKRNLVFGLAMAAVLVVCPLTVRAQGTAFTYQGLLNSGGAPANGTFDIQFALYDSSTGSNLIAGPVTNGPVSITNGLFAAVLDFGQSIFMGPTYWLDIAVRSHGGDDFTELSPRQWLLPAPYAIMANSANTLLGTLPASQLTGTVSNSVLPSNAIFAGAVSAGSFAGAGAGLTSLNGTAVSSGTVADARLSGNVALLNANQTFTGLNQFGTNVAIGATNADRRLAIQPPSNSVEWISFKDTNGTTRWHLNNIGGGLNFAQTKIADFRLFLATNGNVGIGDSNPQTKLSVAGTISGDGSGLTNLQTTVMNTNENLRVVRGVVNSDGTILSGSGFSVFHTNGPGYYVIVYDTPFSGSGTAGNPVVVANARFGYCFFQGDQFPPYDSPSLSSLLIANEEDYPADLTFSFIAVGKQ